MAGEQFKDKTTEVTQRTIDMAAIVGNKALASSRSVIASVRGSRIAGIAAPQIAKETKQSRAQEALLSPAFIGLGVTAGIAAVRPLREKAIAAATQLQKKGVSIMKGMNAEHLQGAEYGDRIDDTAVSTSQLGTTPAASMSDKAPTAAGLPITSESASAPSAERAPQLPGRPL